MINSWLQRDLHVLELCCHCKDSLASHSPSSIFSPLLQLVAELLAGMLLPVVSWVTPTSAVSELMELCPRRFQRDWLLLAAKAQSGGLGHCCFFVHSQWNWEYFLLTSSLKKFVFQINSTILKEDLKRMAENFYAALFGYDEVRRLFSGNVQQVEHLIPEHRVVQVRKTFTAHFFGEILH